MQGVSDEDAPPPRRQGTGAGGDPPTITGPDMTRPRTKGAAPDPDCVAYVPPAPELIPRPRVPVSHPPFEIFQRCQKPEIHAPHRFVVLGGRQLFRCPGKHGGDPL